ncbi:KdsC family phosphatase [Calditerrivibrio nitroreducens]|uniref:3-deoxy-D-manno-octulosonate 8-phosphate phosphatase, YrbI family n=1 Tax=Calditerrivibrio nitroreducens (strain DSM 19672 / NBRC 101217 / Yu37-1) TaxID=768670 RepID=E4TK66_CALNY|nr:HAD-IIIA family hydrolase [Calditerrivibrio nitroreducens]ADR19342.1 3-deoxy-D-manno-octulosonate 8-phosphate phosphatase, YrbI family [Calditerrivibrio nitroreducens DSM 19672]
MNIRLLIMDVDGVLTDGKITYTSSGEEIKSFHVRDGLGIKLAKKAGIELAIISARFSKITELRAKELGIDIVYQGHFEKLDIYEEIKKKLDLADDKISFIGDDLNDIPILKRVGLPATVSDAPDVVKRFAQIVTPQMGGQGAVRHLIEIILKRNNKWEEIVSTYSI